MATAREVSCHQDCWHTDRVSSRRWLLMEPAIWPTCDVCQLNQSNHCRRLKALTGDELPCNGPKFKAVVTRQTNVVQHVLSNIVVQQMFVVCSRCWPTYYVVPQRWMFTNMFVLCCTTCAKLCAVTGWTTNVCRVTAA